MNVLTSATYTNNCICPVQWWRCDN